jgi:hypothetical protein
MTAQYDAQLADQEMLLWLHENADLIQEFKDEILLESIRVEQFDRMYGFLLEDVCPNYRRESVLAEDLKNLDSQLMNESWAALATDLGIAFGSMIPGIGQAIAAGGTFYYLYKAYDNFAKARNFEFAMDIMSAAFTAPQAIPALGTAAGAAGKAAVQVLRSIFGRLFKVVAGIGSFIAKIGSKVKGLFKPAAKMGAAEAKLAQEAMEQTGKLTAELGKNADKLKKISPLVEKCNGYLKALGEFIKKQADKLKPTFQRLGFSTDEAIKTIDKGLEVSEGIAKVTKSASGSADDMARASIELMETTGEIAAKEADDLLKLQARAVELQKSQKAIYNRSYGVVKAEKDTMKAVKTVKDIEKGLGEFGKMSDEAYDIAKATGFKVMNKAEAKTVRAFQRLSKDIPGLQAELTERIIALGKYPKGTTIKFTKEGATILKPGGGTSYMKIFSGSADAATYSNFGKLLKNSSALKTARGKITEELAEVTAKIAKLEAKAAKKVVEEAMEVIATKEPDLIPRAFLEGLSGEATKKIGQLVLGMAATLTSTIETASTEEMDARRKTLEDERDAEFGSSDYTMGAF